ncbi:ArsR/SmtB family transcription factor [Stappia stellulata]|uniref:ArsR/SmtB family transcription factor n=1 Tax=Stappia stellulata TaxID=71235 RepID=UPI000413B13B|nr:metalloregulator ArsR/SmtB family transcription factor [Stappia stellulata]
MAKHDPDLNLLFAALGDETRRAIVSRLARGPASVSELAASHAMALPSFMGHIARLEKAGLIETAKTGRVRYCRLAAGGIAPLEHWLAEQHAVWTSRLDRFDDYVENLAKERSVDS